MNLNKHYIFYNIIKDIKNKDYFLITKTYTHHGANNTVYNHSIKTAYFTFLFCKHLHFKTELLESCVIAALLHDCFGYNWNDPNTKQNKLWKQEKGFNKIKKMHAFNHGYEAIKNLSNYIQLSENQKDAILKHMFPLYPIPPKHIEGWVITLADKIIATQECLFAPIQNIKFNIKNKRMRGC